MSKKGPNQIPASELDKFEWLALEALWGTAITPFSVQWKGWQQHPDIRDPASTSGLVIEGNLWRANLDIRSATEIEGTSNSKVELLSRAAGHIGKLAGGLISMTSHFRTPPELWRNPLAKHIPTHLEVVEEALRQADVQTTTSLDGNYYYTELGPVSEVIRTMTDEIDGDLLAQQAEIVANMASVAIRTWSAFTLEYEGLVLDPGATPRSSGTQIEDLRRDFEQYVPIVHQAAI